MEPQKQSAIFNQLQAAGRITPTELRIWLADQQTPLSQVPKVTNEIREVMRRFFTLYGINPGIQFADTTFKEEFLQEVTKLVVTYYPSISRAAMELAIELNLTNYFGLEKKPEVYGDRITATFLTEILNIYRSKKGPIIQRMERMLPAEEPEPDQEEIAQNIAQLLEEDRKAGQETGIYNLRLPELYYNHLLTTGAIEETDEMIERYMDRARQIRNSMRQQGKMKEASPLSLKDLDITRRFLSQTISLVAIAKAEAVTDYLTQTKQLK